MKYQQTLDFLFTQLPMFQKEGQSAYKPGLGTTLELARAFGNPHIGLCTIHIGGTNGKGSTAHTIAAILQSAGYRTGLFTSPHLIDFRERIRIDGQPIPEEYVTDFTDRYRAMDFGDIRPSFFELTTIMAFEYFKREKVDVAVIEVGLGGRLDCTNIITPLVSVVTNISLDHTKLLGDTPELIAAEKAGIFKPGVPAVVGSASGGVREVFVRAAETVGTSVGFACDEPLFTSAEETAGGILYHDTPWGDICGELRGNCQPENANTVMHALQKIATHFPNIGKEAVAHGFANVCELTGLMGRWMKVPGQKDGVEVICDTGHNIGGWEYLGPKLGEISRKARLRMVVGFVNDKDVSAIMNKMPQEADYYFAAPSVERRRPAESTAEIAAAHGLSGKTIGSGTVSEAYAEALRESRPGDVVFVGGSTFVVADFLKYISER